MGQILKIILGILTQRYVLSGPYRIMLDIYNIEDLSLSVIVKWVLKTRFFRNLSITVVWVWDKTLPQPTNQI